MPLYTPGRRRAIILLLLTSALLLTLDLRGTSIFDSARAGFRRALEPFETAGDVVTKPIRNAWHGIMDYDDLAQENQDLREQIDAQVSDQIAGPSRWGSRNASLPLVASSWKKPTGIASSW